MAQLVKVSAYKEGDRGSIPGLGRSPGGGKGYPLQNSCLGKPTDREAGQATVHRVAESGTTERLTLSHFLAQVLTHVGLLGHSRQEFYILMEDTKLPSREL